MPYILQERREALRKIPIPRSVGELNYCITQLCLEWIAQAQGIDYTTANEIVGVLECVKLEIFRRVVAPYEDGRRDANGEIFT